MLTMGPRCELCGRRAKGPLLLVSPKESSSGHKEIRLCMGCAEEDARLEALFRQKNGKGG